MTLNKTVTGVTTGILFIVPSLTKSHEETTKGTPFKDFVLITSFQYLENFHNLSKTVYLEASSTG